MNDMLKKDKPLY